MQCTMCPNEIPQPRLDMMSTVVTCSRECAAERVLWRKRQGAKRARERQKAARAADRASR